MTVFVDICSMFIMKHIFKAKNNVRICYRVYLVIFFLIVFKQGGILVELSVCGERLHCTVP